ncbi:MAG TPA: SDR family NAD(P)-dependent oxidoreductase [Myxococcota bacterium]|nr:SDR family NAD(P)-dependent oxidoreductase [Myxococcota bacterium]
MRRLEGRVAVVTGAGSGIGRATARALRDAGCELALVDVMPERLAEVRDALAAPGRRVSLHVADVADRARMETLPAEVLAEHGAVHVLVNNAGVTVGRSFEDHDWDDLDWILGIDLWGVIHGCKVFLPHLLRADEAHIVNVSSMAGFVAFPLQSSYSAAKAAVYGFSDALRIELSGGPVGVTSVHPGTIRTRVLADARRSDERLARLVDGMERFGRPPEAVARRIVRAIRHDRTRVRVGADAYLMDWLHRLAPNLPGRLLGLAWRRLQD